MTRLCHVTGDKMNDIVQEWMRLPNFVCHVRGEVMDIVKLWIRWPDFVMSEGIN